jgi:signal peptidase I
MTWGTAARRALEAAVITALVAGGLALVYAILRLTVYDVVRFGAGRDMWPDFGPGALVVANRRATPERGDVVLVKREQGGFALRRVVAVPGDTVAIVDSRPIVDGLETTWREEWRWQDGERTYVVMRETVGGRSYRVVDDLNRGSSNFYGRTIEPGTYYLLADNREHLQGGDSREYGPVPRAKIRAVVSWVLSSGQGP